MVRFIQDTFGRAAIPELVAAFGQQTTCQGGLRAGLDVSLGKLESQWRESLGARSESAVLVRALAPWLLLIVVSLPLLVLAAQPLAQFWGEQRGRQAGHK